MTLSDTDLAQGEVVGLPPRYMMQHRLFALRHGEPFHLTLIVDGDEQQVAVIKDGSHGTPGDGSWYTELTVCPVDTIDTTRKGARIIRISVDASGNATFY